MLLKFKVIVFYFNIFKKVVYSCDGSAAFLVAITSLQCHMTLQKSICIYIYIYIVSHRSTVHSTPLTFL